MISTPFTFRFFSRIGSQKERLLAAAEFTALPLHSSLVTTLKNLESSQSGRTVVVTRQRIWRDSLSSVRSLLVKSALWQSVAIFGMVASLFTTRQILAADYGVALTILLSLFFLGAELFKNVVYYFDMPRRAQLARGVQLHLFGWINRKLLVVDPAQRGDFTSGNVKTLISGDVEAVEDFITAASQAWVPAFLTLALTTPPIIYLIGWLGCIGVGLTLLQLPLAYYSARYVERFKERKQAEQDRLSTVIGEWVKNIRLVRYLHREGAIAREIALILRRFSFESIKAHTVVILSFAITYSWWAVPILGMVAVGTLFALPLEATSFFPALWLLSLLSNQIQFLPHSLTHYGSAAAAVSRLERFLNLPDITRCISEDPLPEVSSFGYPTRVHFDRVSVMYGDACALQQSTFSIDLYGKTAIVGEVGAGKSTLLQLLVAEIAPSSGTIEVEFSSGIRASLWCAEVRSTLRSFVSFAPQEPFLSNSTLRANIDLSGKESEAAVLQAVHDSVLTADVAQLEQGLDQEVGETGINLSGGQRQRVSLGRAFLSKRKCMVLDDSLSAVDVKTEHLLFDAFLGAGSGIILASHRLQHIPRCDRVIVLFDGAVVEDGNPKALLQDGNSHFSRLVNARMGRQDE